MQNVSSLSAEPLLLYVHLSLPSTCSVCSPILSYSSPHRRRAYLVTGKMRFTKLNEISFYCMNEIKRLELASPVLDLTKPSTC